MHRIWRHTPTRIQPLAVSEGNTSATISKRVQVWEFLLAWFSFRDGAVIIVLEPVNGVPQSSENVNKMLEIVQGASEE